MSKIIARNVILCLVCLFIGCSFAKTVSASQNRADTFNYYLPAYISEVNSWMGVALSNANNDHAAATRLVVYNDQGNTVTTIEKNLSASGKTAFLVTSEPLSRGWMLVISSQPLSGLAFYAKLPLMANIPFVDKLEKNLVIPHIAQDDNWETTIMICNPKDNACNVNVINVDDNGGMVAQKSIALTGNGCGSYSLGTLFTAPLGGKIYLQATSEIAAFALYSDTKSGGSYYAGINAVAEDYTIKKVDYDGDGYASDVDCNDNDASIHPGAYDLCGDGIDQDCNGSDSVCQIDNDGDGFTVRQGDCNDWDANIYPGAQDICDGIDNDCDAMIDEGCSANLKTVNIVGNWNYSLKIEPCNLREETGTIKWTYSNGGYNYFVESNNNINPSSCTLTGIHHCEDTVDFIAGNPISKFEFINGMNTGDCTSYTHWYGVDFIDNNEIHVRGSVNGKNISAILIRSN